MATYQSRIPSIVAALERRAAVVVQKTAMDIEAGAKTRTLRVDTGAMKGGWQARQRGPLEWEVINPIEYTPRHEFGTVYISAQPMLAPAVEDARSGFEAGMRQVFGG